MQGPAVICGSVRGRRLATLLLLLGGFGLALLTQPDRAAAENWLRAEAISAGAQHSCAVRQDGQVVCWGSGEKGQLGDGITDAGHQTVVPVKVAGPGGVGLLEDAVAVTAGRDHSCALLASGRVACWGDNARGKLGDGTNSGPVDGFPVEVKNEAGDGPLTGVTQISAGTYNTCAVLDTGRALCWGSNLDGQLGTGGGPDSFLPVEPHGVGGNPALEGVNAVAAGTSFTCAVHSDNINAGQVACWGHNGNGQVGNGTWGGTITAPVPVKLEDSTILREAVSISVGEKFVCAITAASQAYCWGQDNRGQLGIDDNADRNQAVPVLGVGKVGLLDNAAVISAGKEHACAVTHAAEALCWGSGANGRLGDGSDTGSGFPMPVKGIGGIGSFDNAGRISVGGGHSCALNQEAQAVCWGANDFGQLGSTPLDGSDLPRRVRDIPVFLTVKFGGGGAGDIGATDGSVGCAIESGICTEEFAKGSRVTVEAAPRSGSIFTGWSGNCVPQGEQCLVVLDRDETITAEFTKTLKPLTKPTNVVATYNQATGRLRIRLRCVKRFKPRCKGKTIAVTVPGKQGKVMTKPVKMNQKAGKWRVVTLQVKPKFRRQVALMTTINKKQLIVRQVLKVKKRKKVRKVTQHHRYKVRPST